MPISTRVLFTSAKPFERETFDRCLKNFDGRNDAPLIWCYSEMALTPETIELAKGYEALCLFVTDRVDAPSMTKLSEMGVKIIALRSAGFNNVDLAAARENQIKVVRVPKYSPEAVAEFAVALYLTLNRKIHRAHDRIREGNFSLQGLVGRNVHGSTVGVIGTGNIGRCVAQIFKGFGTEVLAYDLQPDLAWARPYGVTYVTLEELLKRSDVVTLHAPLTTETRHLICEERLALMKQGAFLVNTSRGGLVDTPALITALKDHHLGGAALDVYEEEENIFFHDHSDEIIDDDMLARLTTFPNVLITSHQAFLTREALDQIAQTTVTNLMAWRNGEPLINSLLT